MHETEWTQPIRPVAACTVHVTRTDAHGSYTVERLYDADGRILFGTHHPGVDSRGFERFTWEGPRLVRVESLLEQDARDLPCDVVGGCATPKSRTLERRHFRWSGPHLQRVDTEQDVWELTPDETWKHARSDHTAIRYVWKDGRLVGTRGGRGPVTFEYDGARIVRRVFKEGRFEHVMELEWRDGRVSSARWSGYTQTFSYDAQGRLVREELVHPDRPGESRTIEWEYDVTNALVRQTELRRYPAGRERLTWDYSYDDHGRLVKTVTHGRTEQHTYEGDCPAVLGAPRPPQPLKRLNVTPCFPEIPCPTT